uniref:Uncharacterized protein n=1 Tax=Physcomitrium patens TaxID=3218 RepID=A0A2K1IAZ3_PHYPA|nr:hypothetical protein PHYPA_031038 [Physcomitrium patens]
MYICSIEAMPHRQFRLFIIAILSSSVQCIGFNLNGSILTNSLTLVFMRSRSECEILLRERGRG